MSLRPEEQKIKTIMKTGGKKKVDANEDVSLLITGGARVSEYICAVMGGTSTGWLVNQAA